MENKDIEQLLKEEPFLRYIGVEIAEFKEGYCRLSVNLKHELTRSGNIMNGGAIAALADAAGGCVVYSLNKRNHVTADLSLSFMKPIRTGPVTAEARIVKTGKSLTFVDIRIFDGNRVECAMAKGTWFFLDV